MLCRTRSKTWHGHDRVIKMLPLAYFKPRTNVEVQFGSAPIDLCLTFLVLSRPLSGRMWSSTRGLGQLSRFPGGLGYQINALAAKHRSHSSCQQEGKILLSGRQHRTGPRGREERDDEEEMHTAFSRPAVYHRHQQLLPSRQHTKIRYASSIFDGPGDDPRSINWPSDRNTGMELIHVHVAWHL